MSGTQTARPPLLTLHATQVPLPGRHSLCHREGACGGGLTECTHSPVLSWVGCGNTASCSCRCSLVPCSPCMQAFSMQKASQMHPAAHSLAAGGGAVLALALGVGVQGREAARLGYRGGRVPAKHSRRARGARLAGSEARLHPSSAAARPGFEVRCIRRGRCTKASSKQNRSQTLGATAASSARLARLTCQAGKRSLGTQRASRRRT